MAEIIGLASAIGNLVTLVGQVSKLSYGFISDISNAPKSQKMFLQEVCALTEVFLRMEGALDMEEIETFKPSSTMSTSLEECRGLLSSLKHSLERAVEGKSRLAKMKTSIQWPFSEKEVKAAVERLRRYRDMMVATLASNTFTITVATHRKVDRLTQEKNNQRILQWLENPTLPRSSAVVHELACPGTGHWFLTHREYLEWRDGSASLLWCYGHPGVGKTILASMAINDLQRAVEKTLESTTLYFLCDLAKRKAITVLQSFLWQIVQKGDPNQLGLLLQHSRDCIHPSLKELWYILIELLQPSNNTWMVIDALDEFDDRKTLIPIIQRLSKAGVKVLITSRNVPDIQVAFHAEKAFEIQLPRSELEVYVSARFEESDQFDSFDSLNPNSDIVVAIVDLADGLFLLARLLMDHLLSCTNVKQMKRALQAMPSNIADAYESTLQRILLQSSHRATLAMKVIGWISHAGRPLKVEELRHGLAIEESTDCLDEENLTSTKILLQGCMGLVFVDPEDERLYLIHHTAYEYFQQLKEHFARIQLEMTKACLTYLGYSSMSGGPSKSVEELRHRFNGLPFLGYAAQYWGDHARHVEQDLSCQILELLTDEELHSSSFQALQYRELNHRDLAAAIFNSLPKGLEPLHHCAYWDLRLIGESLLRDGVNPDVLDGQEWTALHWACSQGSENMMEILLRYGADINARDLSGWTPLFWAAIKGHEQIITRLLQMKANHFLVDQNGWTVLHWAVSKGNATVSQILLDHHAKYQSEQKTAKIWVRDITVKDAKRISGSSNHHSDTETPLEIAAEKGDIQTFDIVLEDLATRGGSRDLNGLWVQKRWGDPHTSIPWRIMTKADQFDREGLGRWNIETGLGMGWKVKLLHGAIRDGKALVVQLLVELGVDIQNDYKGRTPLQQAALLKDPQIAKILLANGANVTTASETNHERYSPLHIAAAACSERTVQALLQGGFNVNGTTAEGKTPLILACEVATPDENNILGPCPSVTVETLMNYGADVRAMDRGGKNALHAAVAHWRPDMQIIRLLLDNGIDSRAVDHTGHSPFHVFCRSRFWGRVEIDDRKEQILNLLLAHLPPAAENLEIQSRGWEEIKETPLAMALNAENWPVFVLLVEREVLFRTNRPLEELLWKSAYCWGIHPKAIRLLLDNGANAAKKIYGSPLGHTAMEGLFGNQSLIPASLEDFQSILDMYLNHGLDINASDLGQLNLLHKAMSRNEQTYQPALTQYFLDTGIDPYQPVHGIWDAFLLGAFYRQYQALRVLVSRAIKTPKSDHWLRLPEDFDPFQASNDSIIDLIFASLSYHRLLEFPDASNLTLLQKAVSISSASAVTALVAHSANIHVTDKHGWTPLHTATFNNDLLSVEILLVAGAAPNATTAQWPDGWKKPSGLYAGNSWTGTSLHLAAMIGSPAITSLLLECSADVNASTGVTERYNSGHGPTALHIALSKGTFYGMAENLGKERLAVAEVLVGNGAEVEGISEHLSLSDVCCFDGLDDLWENLRGGIEVGEGVSFESCDPDIVCRFGDGED